MKKMKALFKKLMNQPTLEDHYKGYENMRAPFRSREDYNRQTEQLHSDNISSDDSSEVSRISAFAGAISYVWDGKYLSNFAGQKKFSFDGRFITRFGGNKEYVWDNNTLSAFAGNKLFSVSGSKISSFAGPVLYSYDGKALSIFAGQKLYSISGMKEVPIPLMIIIAEGLV